MIIDDQAKREVLEKCASDIMFDYERLNVHERANFDQQYADQVEEMMVCISMLPREGTEHDLSYRVNYRVFNLEALCELRLNLIDYLKDRR